MNGKLFRIVLAGLFAATLTSCGASLEKRKDQADIHYRLGEVHLRERSIADALKELTKAVELYPDNANYHNALGLAYFVKGMNAEAYKSFDRAISIDPKLSDARLNKSAVYLSERKWDNAIEESQAAVKNIFYRTPELAYNNIGWAFHNKGDYGRAVENYRLALQANANYAQAHYNMGLSYEKAGRLKEAVESYRAATAVSPAYLDAYFNLGMALVKVKDKAGALKAFEKVIELAPGSDKGLSAKEYINLIR
ncbi:MAG TPA: hypothetical protein DDW94_02140 [Deltaproteobacteria bacterium]|nr:MAG: hypothetical protein A2Z79_09700 [Deltaproteobacteria bacterium GWA2_55_82]OGQ64990.1 MAG: hypothetical protein A3I81_01925 [Deltaproteobacteria bacterium RIFCSPLOWO2_02_FULL_55_12]OIJ73826.1 MAG: hypothetical protein A2V21_305840 [Deltaproteobacteria bacterium GWC2_55_46]HBG45768.1 hypothetical protein [Deltaproteobacteria bacterium]HCY09813.1 hypothetical protein [Deltaproteobacteria bacterium]